MAELRAPYWMEIAQELYPDETFEAPIDLYQFLGKQMFDLEIDTHSIHIESQWIIEDEDRDQIRRMTVDYLAFANASREYRQDVQNQDHTNLDALVQFHRQLKQDMGQ